MVNHECAGNVNYEYSCYTSGVMKTDTPKCTDWIKDTNSSFQLRTCTCTDEKCNGAGTAALSGTRS